MAYGQKNTERALGTYHISGSDLNKYETARSNFFTFVVTDLNNLVPESLDDKAHASSAYVYGENEAQDAIKLSVKKAFVPTYKLGTIEIKRGNSVVKFADVPTWESGTIDLQDFVGLRTKNILMAWRSLAYDVMSDTQGLAVDYKKDCYLNEYTQDHELIRTWKLIGCWISNISESQFEVDGAGGRELSITLEYDRGYPVLEPGVGNEGIER